jgi:hypothetical protein
MDAMCGNGGRGEKNVQHFIGKPNGRDISGDWRKQESIVKAHFK